MTPAVVVVGPTTVRGPGTVDADLASIALGGIDDYLALVDDCVVPVDQLWRDVLADALAGQREDLVLVCPSWWADSRVARVDAAARSCSTSAIVRRRVDLLPTESTVVEVAPELVVVHTDAQRHAVARVGASADVVEAVCACLDGLDAVTVDIPTGLAHFGAELTRALRRRGTGVTITGDQMLIRAARGQHADVAVTERWTWSSAVTPRAAVLAAAVLSVTALAAVGLGGGSTETDDAEVGTWLVEGRVAVEIPAQWTVERITSGPGSARVEVVSPSDALAAIHITQSRVPEGQTLNTTAETLRLALADEPDGVFVDFAALGRRDQRPVVTYREIRADYHVTWVVMLDRGVRIAIGCQGAPDGSGPEQPCDRAIESAHAVA